MDDKPPPPQGMLRPPQREVSRTATSIFSPAGLIQPRIRHPRRHQHVHRRAPASSSAAAQAFAVAPEVITSSTSNTVRPVIRPARDGRTRNDPATSRARSSGDFSSNGAVRRVRTSASGQHRPPRQPAHGERQHRRLIVFPMKQPPPVQRHRHQHRRLATAAPPPPAPSSAPGCRPVRPGRHASAAGSAAAPARRTAAPPGPAGTPADVRGIPGTPLGTALLHRTERHPAAHAKRSGDEIRPAEAGRAKLPLHRNRIVARRTPRRQQQIERLTPRLPQPAQCQAAASVSPGMPNTTVPSRSISCTRSISHDRYAFIASSMPEFRSYGRR